MRGDEMQDVEVYGEGRELSSLDWTELLFRLEDLFKEFSETVTEGGEPLRETDRRIAETAQEVAVRHAAMEIGLTNNLDAKE
jgi:hypothetical protein